MVATWFYEHPYCTHSVSLSSDKCTCCKSLWMKASAKCPHCKCKYPRFALTTAVQAVQGACSLSCAQCQTAAVVIPRPRNVSVLSGPASEFSLLFPYPRSLSLPFVLTSSERSLSASWLWSHSFTSSSSTCQHQIKMYRAPFGQNTIQGA